MESKKDNSHALKFKIYGMWKKNSFPLKRLKEIVYQRGEYVI